MIGFSTPSLTGTHQNLSKKDYSRLKRELYEASNDWLEEVSPASASYGRVDQDHLQKCFKKLQKKAAPGIKFSEQYLENECYGGTCSALSLKFADELVDRGSSPTRSDILEVAHNNQKSDLLTRTEQAALNAISYNSTKPVDPKRAKVESIVALRDFKVVESMPDLDELVSQFISDDYDLDDWDYDTDSDYDFGLWDYDTDSDYDSGSDDGSYELNINDYFSKSEAGLYQAFKDYTSKFIPGTYFIRMLSSTDNYKGEWYGHSIIYVRTKQNDHFVFDPSSGLYELPKDKYQAHLFNRLGISAFTWGLETPRIYRIEKEESKSLISLFTNCLSDFIAPAA